MSEKESKQSGNVQVHKKVLEEIVYTAVKNIDGVRLGRKGFFSAMIRALAGVRYPGVHVKLDNANGVNVSLEILVRYGINIPEIARQAQDAVFAALEQTTEVDVKDVNVNVQGVSREV